jgi:hypothetical protein
LLRAAFQETIVDTAVALVRSYARRIYRQCDGRRNTRQLENKKAGSMNPPPIENALSARCSRPRRSSSPTLILNDETSMRALTHFAMRQLLVPANLFLVWSVAPRTFHVIGVVCDPGLPKLATH